MTDHGSLQPQDGASVPSVQEDKPAASVADILDWAADLIEPEGAWTQGAFARTKDGEPIGPLEAPATCWCLYGAIDKAGEDLGVDAGWDADRALFASLRTNVPKFNDAPERTQAEVVAALRQAAERARALGEQA